jgi:hypothetical protein
LPRRLEFAPLADTAPANPEIVHPALAAGEQRRAARAAEMLIADAAVVAALSESALPFRRIMIA